MATLVARDCAWQGRRLCAGSQEAIWVLGLGSRVGGGGRGRSLSTGWRSLLGLTPLPLGQCSASTAWSTPVPPGGLVATLVTTATFSGARMPGTLTRMCCCLPRPHGHPPLKVRGHPWAGSRFPAQPLPKAEPRMALLSLLSLPRPSPSLQMTSHRPGYSGFSPRGL